MAHAYLDGFIHLALVLWIAFAHHRISKLETKMGDRT